MAVNWQAVAKRVTTLGEDGKYLPAITGDESLEDLREMILHMSEACPLGQNCMYCPFRIMQGLSSTTLEELITGLDRLGCLDLFAMEHACRNDPQGKCRRPFRDFLSAPADSIIIDSA